jgi:cobalt/nickel transport protein
LILLTPLGLFLPEYFKAGDAWGEWGSDTIRGLVGYIPRGLEKLSGFWNAPLPDYAFKGWEERGLPHLGLAYIVSAVIGIVVIAVVVMGLGKFLAKKEG